MLGWIYYRLLKNEYMQHSQFEGKVTSLNPQEHYLTMKELLQLHPPTALGFIVNCIKFYFVTSGSNMKVKLWQVYIQRNKVLFMEKGGKSFNWVIQNYLIKMVRVNTLKDDHTNGKVTCLLHSLVIAKDKALFTNLLWQPFSLFIFFFPFCWDNLWLHFDIQQIHKIMYFCMNLE